MQPASRLTYRADIDGLRAVAVICVVGYHAFPEWLPGGFVGVDVFFVISGFLISGIIFEQLAERRFELLGFYARRIRRIFPALLTTLVATYALAQLVLLSHERRELLKHMAGGAGFVSNFILWSEASYFDGEAETKPLLHLWSLAIEEQFYLIWPVLLGVAWRFKRSILPLLLTLVAASACLNLFGIRQDAVATFYSPQTRFWELWCGAALAWVTRTSESRGTPILVLRSVQNGVALTGVLVLVLVGAWLDANHPYPGAWAALPVGAAVALIVAGPNTWVNRVVLSSRPLVWIGLVSYPLYLWHWPLLSLARIAAGTTPDAAIRAAVVLVALVLAWLTYRLLERPIRQSRHGTRTAISLASLMAAVGCASLAAYQLRSLSADELSEAANASQLGWRSQPASAAQVQSCRARFPERNLLTSAQRDDNFCLLARDAAADVLLVGDSMALSLFPGLSHQSEFNTLVLAASSAAPLYDTRTTAFDDVIRINNYRMTNHALDYALRDANIKVVVMGFVGGPTLVASNGSYRITDISNPAETSSERIFSAALTRTLNRLVAQNKRVIYVLPNPKLSFDIRDCVARRPFEPDAPRICDEHVGSHMVRGGRIYRNWVAAVLKDFPQVRVFDAADSICDGSRCWGVRDGRLLYRDQVHLSTVGSEAVAASLSPLIREALQQVR